MYRQQVKQNREDRKYMQDQQETMIREDQATRERHTTALTGLLTWLKRHNGD